MGEMDLRRNCEAVYLVSLYVCDTKIMHRELSGPSVAD